MERKSTNKELVSELEAINKTHRLDTLIKNAKNNRYHDYKNPDDVVCGKMQFCAEACKFPECNDLIKRVQDGEFDEVADEEDKADMRKNLPVTMWGMLGLNPLN